jgi:hypothetical protein
VAIPVASVWRKSGAFSLRYLVMMSIQSLLTRRYGWTMFGKRFRKKTRPTGLTNPTRLTKLLPICFWHLLFSGFDVWLFFKFTTDVVRLPHLDWKMWLMGPIPLLESGILTQPVWGGTWERITCSGGRNCGVGGNLVFIPVFLVYWLWRFW